MKINIFGSTGTIGIKTLELIDKYNLKLNVNLLVCKTNYKKLIIQIKKYKPKYVFIDNEKYFYLLKSKKLNTKILSSKQNLDKLLLKSRTDLTVLAIDGISALKYLNSIIINTKNLGLVNKECIVSAGHLFLKLNYFKKTNIFPLDSEHFSIFKFLKQNKFNKKIKKIFITASGGSLYKKNKRNSILLKDILNHPKWKMGIKNSVDSSTLANKCLEVIEAKYLFNIDFNKIDIILHPEALVHSIIQFDDYTYVFNYFFNDMSIPLMNFLFNVTKNNDFPLNREYEINKNFSLTFDKSTLNKYSIYKIFNSLNKNDPNSLIKFNILNEFAVKMYINGKLQFHQIPIFIKKNLKYIEKNNLNSINKILDYNNKINSKLNAKYFV